MPRWTINDLCKIISARKNAKLEHSDVSTLGSATQTQEVDTGGIHVCITNLTTRPQDPDNLCEKYFLDCLRYAELIPDDNPSKITLETRQRKVFKKEDEGVIMEVSYEGERCI